MNTLVVRVATFHKVITGLTEEVEDEEVIKGKLRKRCTTPFISVGLKSFFLDLVFGFDDDGCWV